MTEQGKPKTKNRKSPRKNSDSNQRKEKTSNGGSKIKAEGKKDHKSKDTKLTKGERECCRNVKET